MNPPDILHPHQQAMPDKEHWIEGDAEIIHPRITPLNEYPDDARIMHIHPLHQDENVLIERKKLEASPDYRGPKDHLVFTTVGQRHEGAHLYRGDLVLDINESRYHLKRSSSEQVIVLRTQEGDDEIIIDDDVQATVFIDSGAGADRVQCGGGFTKVHTGSGNDSVFTRSGASYIETGEGDDYVSALGDGPVTVYGGQDHDTLDVSASKGACFVEGGQGDDLVAGGQGQSNVLSGGEGDDEIIPGPGPTTIYTGTGTDLVSGLRADMQLFNAYSTSQPTPATLADDPGVMIAAKGLDTCGVIVEGSPRFQERVNDDLRLLLGSGNGQQLLDALGRAKEASGVPVVIKELSEEENGMCHPGGTEQDHLFIEHGQAGTPAQGCTVYYDPSFLKAEVTSIVHLYHELCHAYNFVTGTTFPGLGPDGVDAGKPRNLVRNAELQAVGLEAQVPAFDFDANSATPPLTTNPEAFTENGLRLEFGIPPRKQYRED
ncbi:hypothetical protein HX870_32355 [Pseudomonas gingeri]|uniref:M91 family zinc metallopeptidase n=1 Tax=Pseudomonas gingeri TaxID=117681 RepID=UPI0015A06DA0|nr:M91 family zinc metallopeptidase [Pseudomonas gingeri]NWD72302.1 hypothetical protein [Pseudomonas gingeri]